MEHEPILAMEKISKSFPGVVALSDVDFRVYPKEIVALVGENGAGKSTLIKILTGVYRKDSGRILMYGQEIEPRSPNEAFALGLPPEGSEIHLQEVQSDSIDGITEIALRPQASFQHGEVIPAEEHRAEQVVASGPEPDEVPA